MKIIDCFPYFNEEEHLILRINLLKDYVDGFVICEANRTHTGILKEYTVEETLRNNNILFDKIYIHKVELPSKEEEPNDWVRERKQRDDVSKLIKENEVWFISDCDEIINPEYIKWFTHVAIDNPDNILRVRMSLHECNVNYQVYLDNFTPIHYNVPFFILKHHTEKYTLSQIRESISWDKPINYSSIFVTENDQVIESGWHLTWMGSPERRIKKLKSFMHFNDFVSDGIGKLNTTESINHIENYIPYENNFDILNRTNHILKKYDTSKLPRLIFENEKLKKFFVL